MQLLREIDIASVGSVVVSRGLEDKKKLSYIKLIMNSVSQRVGSCGRWRLDRHQKEKHTHLEEEEVRAEDTVGICVIRRSVSLATTGRQCWTATEVVGLRVERKKQSSIERDLILGYFGIAKLHYLIFSWIFTFNICHMLSCKYVLLSSTFAVSLGFTE